MTVYTTQFSDLYNAVIQQCRLDATADLARSKAWINVTLTDVAVRSRFFSGSAATAALAANATNDTLPTSIVELEDVTCTYGGAQPALVEVSFERLLWLRQASGQGGGPPVYYCLRKNTVEFWPAAQGGEVLTYYGATLPPVLVADADTSGLPEPYASQLLIYGASIRAAEFKSDLLLLGEYQQQYGAWMGSFMAFCNQRRGSQGWAFEVWTPGVGGYRPHDPSSDWYVRSGVPWN